jgi:hypothetical protein
MKGITISNLYRVFVKEPGPGDSLYHTIIVEHATYGEHVTNISAITEAAKSISHCDISYIVNLCRLDIRDAYRILRQLNDSGSVVFEVTAVYLLTSQLI